jgi:predicted signal transduction protein with EAL and GGDEF domain
VLLAAGEGSASTVASNLAYPLADLLLGGSVMLGCAIAHWRSERALLLLGTGQTSLAYLRKLSLDEIKIDRSFVLELGRDEDAAAIVRSTVQMAQALRLRVVAEGAEDAAAMRRLQEFGCELVQGFFLSPPLPAAEITEWLRAQQTSEDPAAEPDLLRDLAAEYQ